MERVKQREIKQAAQKLGFSDPNSQDFLQQAGACVRDHDHFRKILLSCEPEQRKICYDAMRPHIFRFKPWPMDRYIIKGQQEAEELQLPVFGKDGKLVAYKDYHGEKPSLDVMAQDAIADAERERNAKGAVTLICDKCTREGRFPAEDYLRGLALAKEKGWILLRVPPDDNWKCFCGLQAQPGCKAHTREIAICPKCPTSARVVGKRKAAQPAIELVQ